jgi:hypothetical protein
VIRRMIGWDGVAGCKFACLGDGGPCGYGDGLSNNDDVEEDEEDGRRNYNDCKIESVTHSGILSKTYCPCIIAGDSSST